MQEDTCVQMYLSKFSNQWFGFDPQNIITVVVVMVVFRVSKFWFLSVFKSQKVN